MRWDRDVRGNRIAWPRSSASCDLVQDLTSRSIGVRILTGQGAAIGHEGMPHAEICSEIAAATSAPKLGLVPRHFGRRPTSTLPR